MKHTWNDFIGNKEAKAKVQLLVAAAKNNNSIRISDMAFLGPSGHGKNTLAETVADEIARTLITINATVIRDPFQFRSLITSGDYNATGAIIHVDECHVLPRKIQDNLLSALESPRELHTSHKDQIFTDSLPSNISFIFSTTHAAFIRKPLLGRLELIEIRDYTPADYIEMAVGILVRLFGIKREDIEPAALVEIANRARNGRDIRKFCENIQKYMVQNSLPKITKEVVEKCFDILGVDRNGLTRVDRDMLRYMAQVNSFVGLDTLEALMNLNKKEIKDNIEPFLLRKGFINRHTAGRIITPKGYKAVVSVNDAKEAECLKTK